MRYAERLATKRRGALGLDVAIRIDASRHREQRLDLIALAFLDVGIAVGQFEVDRRETKRPGARDMGDLHARGLQRDDAGPRALGVSGKID